MDDPVLRTLTLVTLWLLHAHCQANTRIGWSTDLVGYSGPIAIMALDNHWNGTLEDEDHGFLWHQERLSIQHHDFSLSYVKRHHAEYEFPNDVARGFYYQNNTITLDQRYSIQSYIQARHYQGEGLSLAHQWSDDSGQHQWSLEPALTWLKLHRLVWGKLSGDLFYQAPNDWGGDVTLDYGYTRDYVVRRPLDGHTYGNLWAADLTASYRFQRWQWNYQGHNLLARIQWNDLPYTEARFCTECAFLLKGREFFDERTFRAPAVHTLMHRFDLTEHWQLGLTQRVNRIFTTHQWQVHYRHQRSEWQLGYEPKQQSWHLGFQHPAFAVSVQSDSLNTGRSRRLGLNLGLNITF